MLALLIIGALCATAHGGRLQVQGTHLVKDGKQVFLSGTNLAWINYAYDFGNHHYANVKGKIDTILSDLHAAGGNSIRVWVHIQGESTPVFDGSGQVTGLDTGGTFISDFKALLDSAQKHHILVIPCLWNAAVNGGSHKNLDGLIKDPHKLQTFLDKALTPWVKAVSTHPALGAWEIINEPEGQLIPGRHDADPCYDTQHLQNSGAGWAGQLYTYQDMLRFINWQAAAIRAVDPAALVTVGSWNTKASTDQFGHHNHYKDSCLTKAGGKHQGTIQFYQVHSYSWQGHFEDVAPFKKSFADYKLDKPLVIGEFRASEGGGMTIQALFNWAYDHGYSGAWTWQANESDKKGDMDTWTSQRSGISVLKTKGSPATQIAV